MNLFFKLIDFIFSPERKALLGRRKDCVCGFAGQLCGSAVRQPSASVEGGAPRGPTAGGPLGLPGPWHPPRYGWPPGGPVRLWGAAGLRPALCAQDERGWRRLHFRGLLAHHIRPEADRQRPVLLQPAPPLLRPAGETHLPAHRQPSTPGHLHYATQNYTEWRPRAQ